MDVSIAAVGQHRGAARVWLEGRMLERAGFGPKTRYGVVNRDNGILLMKQERGVRLVSARKRGEREIPIIDINSGELLALFAGLSHVRVVFKANEIHILPLATELRAKERLARTEARIEAGEPLQVGSLAHGGGILSHAIHAGLEAGGLSSELAFANEIREELTDHAMGANPLWTARTIALNGPMQELAFDERVMKKLPQVDVLEAGLPCSGASIAGKAKRGLSHAESHPEVGHLVVAFLAIIARVNPTVIVLENVPQYADTASMEIIRHQLRDMQYDVQETVLDGGDWNCLEHRKRMCMVAVTRGMSFDFALLAKPAKVVRQLAEVLEPIAADDARWSEMRGLKAKQIRDKEAGKGFAMQIYTGAEAKINTLTKGIAKNRSTDPKIAHPENPDLLRIPTAVEHARCKDVPESLIAGLSQTTSHELLGQSINYSPFVAVGQLVAQSLRTIYKNALSENVLPLFRAAA